MVNLLTVMKRSWVEVLMSEQNIEYFDTYLLRNASYNLFYTIWVLMTNADFIILSFLIFLAYLLYII